MHPTVCMMLNTPENKLNVIRRQGLISLLILKINHVGGVVLKICIYCYSSLLLLIIATVLTQRGWKLESTFRTGAMRYVRIHPNNQSLSKQLLTHSIQSSHGNTRHRQAGQVGFETDRNNTKTGANHTEVDDRPEGHFWRGRKLCAQIQFNKMTPKQKFDCLSKEFYLIVCEYVDGWPKM